MKIIREDNFSRDSVDDVLICDNVSEFYGRQFVGWLNDKYSGERSPNYFRLVKDDYELYKCEI